MTRFHALVVAAPLLAVGIGFAVVPSDSPVARGPDSAAVDRGIRFFEARVADRPTDVVAGVELASRYLMRFGAKQDIDDVERAETVLQDVLRVLPGFGPALARMVPVHIARHEFPEALAAARAAYEAAPRRATNGLLFDTWFEVGQYDSAVAALNRMDPGTFGYLTRTARFAEQTGRPEIAHAALHRACRSSNTLRAGLGPWCLVRRGDVQLALGNPKAADDSYREALAARPGYTAALMGRAEVALGQDDVERAERLFLAAGERPGGAEGFEMAARLATFRNDAVAAERASALFERAASDPRYKRAFWGALAVYLARRGQRDSALALARADVRQRPGPESYHTLGAVLYETGKLTESRDALDSAMTWDAPSPETRFYAGMVRIALGDRDAGVVLLEEALADGLAPDHAAAAEANIRTSRTFNVER